MMCGSLTFAFGIYSGNFAIYCLGAIPAGLGFGISQHLRFAAAEVADQAAKARAISLVLAGGVTAVLVPSIPLAAQTIAAWQAGIRDSGTYRPP